MTKQMFLIMCSLCLGLFSCKQNMQTATQKEVSPVEVPVFNPDSAYRYTAEQVAFGPRVPNTEAHRQCGNYLAGKLRAFGAGVIEQEAVFYTYNQIALNGKNIIGSFQPDNKKRVLLFAHWDSRPFADHDPDPANHHTPVGGANDGAGACGILLEIARQIGIRQPSVGVDIVFFDAEDWGAPEFDENARGGWCLGSAYWAQHPHIPTYNARFGILLDMVSAKNALFYKEINSLYHAGAVVDKVWEAARREGYGAYFVNRKGGSIQDDHLEVFNYLQIPCIDIIQYDPDTNSGFGAYWHTVNDTMEAVSKDTQKAVGQTVLYVVYNEK